MKTALKICYKGTSYNGWQVQPGKPSVQKTLQDAIENAFETTVSVHGCSRTDSGVHANEYFCHLDSLIPVSPDRIPYAVNKYLPDDICVLKAYNVSDEFHSRYSAKGKEYMYRIHNSGIKNVFEADTSYMYPKKIDVEKINEVGKDYVGTHDFSGFMATGGKKKESTVRTVWYFKAERDGEFVNFYVAADGFLYNMVRIMVGTAIDAARGRIKIPLSEVILSKNRSLGGKTVPSKGLYLNKVFYDGEFDFIK